jgi:two-component system, cell cycle sensor histidine kinase and response regulator CckA
MKHHDWVPTILVVDDEPSIRRMLALVLQERGFAVLTAEGGQQALSMSRAHHGEIDLLVSDVTMPEMDGPTLAKNLVSENPTLPVLLISGYCDSEQFEKCRPFSLLPKPLYLASFLSAVQNLTSKPRV